jgi:sugar lactone lactonase YvrE
MYEVEHLLKTGNELGEGPLWSPSEGRLWWVDIFHGHINVITPGAATYQTYVVDGPVGCIGFREKGGFIVSLKTGIGLYDPATGTTTHLVNPEPQFPQARFNDGKVDRAGRFWTGSMDTGGQSGLYRYDADGSVHKMESGIKCSNGLGWSPDNRTMYYNDSQAGTIWAYDFDFASGTNSNRRVFYKAGDGGEPDGLTIDSEGCLWTAVWDGWCVLRFDPAGKLMTKIDMPVQRPTCPTFGGANLDELYVTSAYTGLTDEQRKPQPSAGDLFRIDPGVKGLPEPKFAG